MGNLYASIDECLPFTREKFNSLCSDLFMKIEDIVQSTLKEAGFDANQINEVIMVGGSSRIPKVHEIVRKIFPDKKLNHLLQEDEAVAYGATICAAKYTNCDEVQQFSFHDATPMGLGIEVVDDRFKMIIPRNSNIPIEREMDFATSKGNQKSINIAVAF